MFKINTQPIVMIVTEISKAARLFFPDIIERTNEANFTNRKDFSNPDEYFTIRTSQS